MLVSFVKTAGTRTYLALSSLLTAALLLSCTNEVPETFVAQRDSSGITIVESSAPRWSDGEGWTIDPEPLLDFATSGSGPAHEFHRVTDALRLADGTVAVANAGSGEIRFFSPTGAYQSTVGREGEGPGEFQRLSSLDRFRGDSLLAFDYWARRVTVLSPGLEVARVISLSLPFLWKLHPLGDDALLCMLSWPSVLIEEGEDGLVRMPVPVVRFSMEGDVIDTVGFAAGGEEVRIKAEGGFSSARPLFGRQSQLAAHDGLFYLGAAIQMQYRIYSADGTLQRIARVPRYDLRLRDAELEAETDAILGISSSPQARARLELLPVPETKPAYTNLLVDAEGCVWAEEHIGEVRTWFKLEPSRWEVFSSEGEWLGSVRTPSRFTVLEIGTDYLLGVFRDDLDVEHVQLLRLNR